MFSDPSPKLNKSKNKQNGLIKLTRFCTAKETIDKRKRLNGRKYLFANDVTDKGLKSNISKQLIQTSEKQITLLKNGQKNWTDTFQNGNAYDQQAHEKMSTSLIIREMLTKTTVRYHLIPVRMATIKKNTNSKCFRGRGENRTLIHCWWKCKFVQLVGNCMDFPQEPKNGAATWLSNATPEYTYKTTQNYSLEKIHAPQCPCCCCCC